MKNNLIKIITDLYNIKPVKFVENIQTGLRNNFALTDGETKYFLRQYMNYYDEERIIQIHNVKSFFFKGNIPVILPITCKNNLSYFLYEGHYYSLFPYIESISLDKNNLSKHALKSMALMLAKIHLLSKNNHPQKISVIREVPLKHGIHGYKKDVFINNVEKLLQIIKEKNSKDTFDKLAMEALAFKMAVVKKSANFFDDLNVINDHLIHGDYHNHNLFFDKNGNVKYVFDLEQSGMAPRMYEVARTLELLFFDESFDDTNFRNASIFLREYGKHYPFAKEDFVTGVKIRYSSNVYAWWIEKMHYIDKHNRADKFLKGQLNRIKYFSENFDDFLNRLVLE